MTTTTSHDTPERRQAIWPWILMPLVVLVVFYTLRTFEDSARSAAAQASQAHSTSAGGDTVQP